ncbi:uncharacterized protein [Haliotis asinina]|uniref:uncharacterized protein isoform X2 n=1 Tax=Haliotis asinina TaxID=109174 RepID=UPI0035326858
MIFPLLSLFLGGCLKQASSLVLTSSPKTATEGEHFTLICSSNTTGGQDRQWSRNGTSPLLITTQGSTSYTVSNPDIFNGYLSGRINVSCDATQHNVTLRVNSTVDNGSVWQCVDYGGTSKRSSNRLTICVTVDQTTVNTTTCATSVPPTRTTDSTGPIGQFDIIAIAAGAAGGGVAVIAVVIVAAVCIRKKRRCVEDTVKDESRPERNPSRSAEMLIESRVTGEDENDVYTEVKKVKTNADQHELTDMYAKPLKGRKETPNGNTYAQVKKVKSREGTGENIEDMYSKPQKDKRNVLLSKERSTD